MTTLIRKIEPGRMPLNILIRIGTRCLQVRRQTAALLRITWTTHEETGPTAKKKACMLSHLTEGRGPKSAFLTATAAATGHGTLRTQPGGAARTLWQPHTASACSTASPSTERACSITVGSQFD